jgi:hypothetical protein
VKSSCTTSRIAIAGVLLAGCARALPPPGGEPDQSPPEVIATTPENLSADSAFDGEVVFTFDERISERGVRESILVSPATSDVRVEKGRSEIRVRLKEGWNRDQVYRVVLLPGIRDLFGNERRAPASLVFSTGPAVPNTAIGGTVFDKLTGRPATQVVVQASRMPDSVTYNTVGDSSAFFAMTHLPVGQYEVTAFIDQNRNRRRDPTEGASHPQAASLAREADTLVMILDVVPADTTPARVTNALARDSVEIRLDVDDHLDPDFPTEDIQAAIFSLPDSIEVPGRPRIMRADKFDAEKRAREDSLRAAARADSAADPPVRRPAGPPPALGRPFGQAPDTSRGPLPYRELVMVPERPLTPGTRYFVRIVGLRNVTGVYGGGGVVEFMIPTPEPPPRRDTTNVSPGSRSSAPAAKARRGPSP